MYLYIYIILNIINIYRYYIQHFQNSYLYSKIQIGFFRNKTLLFNLKKMKHLKIEYVLYNMCLKNSQNHNLNKFIII